MNSHPRPEQEVETFPFRFQTGKGSALNQHLATPIKAPMTTIRSTYSNLIQVLIGQVLRELIRGRLTRKVIMLDRVGIGY
ncbi:hypothetical protein CEXT_553871 [Caerostris extrusa]|uniref:Uncharacterized protein n=1 Tax=Caerostris extrusa TaxID=172846 RepID=A0AAV4SD65_CAEEX|nr:hypothetical protein CEXT_553871 [Caerostris extrusa]